MRWYSSSSSRSGGNGCDTYRQSSDIVCSSSPVRSLDYANVGTQVHISTTALGFKRHASVKTVLEWPSTNQWWLFEPARGQGIGQLLKWYHILFSHNIVKAQAERWLSDFSSSQDLNRWLSGVALPTVDTSPSFVLYVMVLCTPMAQRSSLPTVLQSWALLTTKLKSSPL